MLHMVFYIVLICREMKNKKIFLSTSEKKIKKDR